MSKSELEEVLALQIEASDLPLPEREYRFHPTRKWQLDFAWLLEMVAAEVEGGTWSQGRHVRGAGFDGDCIKYAEAWRLGWTVFRFTRRMVENGSAIRYLQLALEKGDV